MLPKLFQKNLYTFLHSSWGIVVCVIGALWTFNTLITVIGGLVHGGERRGRAIVPASVEMHAVWPAGTPVKCGSHTCLQDYGDNLIGMSFESRMCLPQVDAVYTWVHTHADPYA
jgi:hypothetical protein